MNYFDEFSALISRWQDAYTCAAYSYVGLKTPKGNHLLCGKILFELDSATTEKAPFTFESNNIIAGRFVKKMTSNDVNAVVTKSKIGQIHQFDEVVSLIANDRQSTLSVFAPGGISVHC